MTRGNPPRILQLRLRINTGQPKSRFAPAGETALSNRVTAYGIRLADLSVTIADQQSSPQVGPDQVTAGVLAAINESRKGIDWPILFGGAALGVLGNTVPDFFPVEQVTGETFVIATGSILTACGFGMRAMWNSLRGRA